MHISVLLEESINYLNLKKDSIVKTDEIYEIKDVDIDKKIGKINIDVVDMYIKMYKGEYDE